MMLTNRHSKSFSAITFTERTSYKYAPRFMDVLLDEILKCDPKKAVLHRSLTSTSKSCNNMAAVVASVADSSMQCVVFNS